MTTRYFSYIANRIAAAKTRADVLASEIGHPGLAGEIREIAVKDCVEPFLTQSYQCGNGKIIDSFDNLSDQIDMLVYHRKVAPPILVNRDLGFFPIECVRYAFEVKSRLTAEEVRDANKKFSSISNLISFPQKQPDGTIKGGARPTTVLFAFGSDIQGSELDRYMKHTVEGHPPCTVLCVLGKGYWIYNASSRTWNGGNAASGSPQYAEFCGFITGFMNSLAAEEMSLRPFTPGFYVNFSDFVVEWKSIDTFRKPDQSNG